MIDILYNRLPQKMKMRKLNGTEFKFSGPFIFKPDSVKAYLILYEFSLRCQMYQALGCEDIGD